MSSRTRNPGVVARPTDLPATGLTRPGNADIGLSAAFRSALGAPAADAHGPAAASKQGREIARLARSAKPAPRGKGTAHKTHIGPRSGHK